MWRTALRCHRCYQPNWRRVDSLTLICSANLGASCWSCQSIPRLETGWKSAMKLQNKRSLQIKLKDALSVYACHWYTHSCKDFVALTQKRLSSYCGLLQLSG